MGSASVEIRDSEGEVQKASLNFLSDEFHDSTCNDSEADLEDYFILRLPKKAAKYLHKQLRHRKRAENLSNLFSVNLSAELNSGVVQLGNKKYVGEVVNLPTTIDVNKSVNGVTIYKTGSISQMLVVDDDAKLDKIKFSEWPHGITPPMKNAAKHRFRNMVRSDTVPRMSKKVQREVAALLRRDNEATHTRYEISYEPLSKTNEDLAEDLISSMNGISEIGWRQNGRLNLVRLT